MQPDHDRDSPADTLPTPAATDAPAGGAAGRPRRVLRTGLAVAGVLVVLLVAAVAGLALVHRGEALPGTVAAGVDVGGRDPAEVLQLLAPVAAERAETPVVLTVPGTRTELTPAEAGYSVDLDATVQRALDAGREGGPLSTGWAHVASLWDTRSVPLVDAVDRDAVRARVDAVAAEADRAPDPGGIVIDPATLAVARRPPAEGVTVRREEAVDAVAAALAGPRQTLALPADVEEPGTTPEDVEAVAAAAEAALAGPVVLTGEGGLTLTLDPRAYAPLLGSEPDGQDALRLAVDVDGLGALVAAAAAEQVDQEPRSARVRAEGPPPVFDDQDDAVWSPRPATVRVVEPSAPGRTVQVAAATAAAEAAIRSGTRAGELPVEVTEPPVTTEAAQRMNAVIGTFTTYHAAGQPRVRNIHRIADEIDGTVVPPGGQFSIDRITGRRTLAEGYVAAPVIVRGELEDGVAGGISQFATTMFNAAFFAGLPLDEFRPHSFYISRYPMGREATLAYGVLDVKWTNDTGAPILVDTSYTSTSITVTLYGDNGGRRVEADLGSPRYRADGGFTVDVTRTVSGPVSSRRTITTRYNPPPED